MYLNLIEQYQKRATFYIFIHTLNYSIYMPSHLVAVPHLQHFTYFSGSDSNIFTSV